MRDRPWPSKVHRVCPRNPSKDRDGRPKSACSRLHESEIPYRPFAEFETERKIPYSGATSGRMVTIQAAGSELRTGCQILVGIEKERTD